MRARVTLNDIAASAGVSRATVSLVLRNNPVVARATRERVQSSIVSLGYVYDRAAANLRARHTHTVGLVVCEITNPFYAELTAGIDEALDDAGWIGFLANTAESPTRQDRFIERMREHRVDGLLLCPAEGTKVELIDRLQGYGLPMVQVLRRLGRREADHVGADFRLGMTLAVEHFIRLGHHRIAFVGGGRHASPALDRARAYRETLTRYGLPIGAIVNCLPTREEGERAVEGLMRGRSNDPTAIVCHNDLCAIGVLVGLSDRGLVARQRLRGDRIRQHSRSRAFAPGADDDRHRRAPDRRGGGSICCCGESRRPPGRLKASSCRRDWSFARVAAARLAQERSNNPALTKAVGKQRDQTRRKRQ